MTQRAITTVEIYEIDQKEVSEKHFRVESHWNDRDLIVICKGTRRWTVNANEMRKAIENATNIDR